MEGFGFLVSSLTTLWDKIHNVGINGKNLKGEGPCLTSKHNGLGEMIGESNLKFSAFGQIL